MNTFDDIDSRFNIRHMEAYIDKVYDDMRHDKRVDRLFSNYKGHRGTAQGEHGNHFDTASILPTYSDWDLLLGGQRGTSVSTPMKSKPVLGQGLVQLDEGCTQPYPNAYKHSKAQPITVEGEPLDIYECHNLLKKRAKHLAQVAASLVEEQDETMYHIMQIRKMMHISFHHENMRQGVLSDEHVKSSVGRSNLSTSGRSFQIEPAGPHKREKCSGYAPHKVISNLADMDDEKKGRHFNTKYQQGGNVLVDRSQGMSSQKVQKYKIGKYDGNKLADGEMARLGYSRGHNKCYCVGDSRENIKVRDLPFYNGKTCWSDFIHQFELLAKLNNWNYQKITSDLISHVQGDAQSVLSDLPKKHWFDYNRIKFAMVTRLEPTSQAAVYRALLKGRKRNGNESLPGLAHDIRKFYRKAYPQDSGINSEVRLTEIFTDALADDMMAWYIVQTKPASLDKAVQIAVEYEAFYSSRKKDIQTHKLRAILKPHGDRDDKDSDAEDYESEDSTEEEYVTDGVLHDSNDEEYQDDY